MTIGASLIFLSGITRSLTDSVPTLCMAVALFGVGGPLVSSCAPTAIGIWFTDDRERKFAVGASITAPAIGSMAILVLSNSVLMPLTNSWRWTIAIETLPIAIALFFWVAISDIKIQKSQKPHDGESETLKIWKSTIESSEIKIIFFLGVAVFFLSHGLGGWMPELLRENFGFSSMAASNWTAGSMGVGIFVSLFLPPRTQRQNLFFVLCSVLVLILVSLISMIFIPSYMIPLSIMIGGSRSVLVPLVILALMESPKLNPKQMGTAYGLWFASAEVGGVLGPVVVGSTADTTFGYDGAIWLMAIVCLVMIFLAYALRMRMEINN